MKLTELRNLEIGTEVRLKGTNAIFEVRKIDPLDDFRPVYLRLVRSDKPVLTKFYVGGDHTILYPCKPREEAWIFNNKKQMREDVGVERSPDTIDCYVNTVNSQRQHFGRVNKHQLDKLREIVKLADAKVYLISSWSVAFKIEEIQNVQETFDEFFGFEVMAAQCGMQSANGRAQFALEILESEPYDAAVYLDDMQDFDPEILQELQSKCFVPVIKGYVGLRDFDFEAIKEYFGVANIN